MKLTVPNIFWLSVIFVFYVDVVQAQFAKGVVKNNVFYVNETSGGSSDNFLNLKQSTTNSGYLRNKYSSTMTSPLPYSTLPATSVPILNYRLKKPASSPWNEETLRPVIAYTLPANMKVKLENAVRHQGYLGSRTRITKKMHTATTPEYEAPEVNGIIIKNFINHLSTTKSNIESTIPNPNQFYTTPSANGEDVAPLVIQNSNSFFPANQMNLNNINGEQDDDDSPPIIVHGGTNLNHFPVHFQNDVAQEPPVKYTQSPPLPVHPVESTVAPIISSHSNIRIPIGNGAKPTYRPPSANPSKNPIRRRPQSQHNNQKPAQHNNRQTSSAPVENQSQNLQLMLPNAVDYQQKYPSSMPVVSQNLQYQSSQSQQQNPVIFAPTKENSFNIYNGILQQPADPQHVAGASSINSFDSVTDQYPIHEALSQPAPQIVNSISSLQTLTGQQLGHQQPLQMTHDSAVNRPNNSLKQLQLQFLLDCSLLDPLTKTKIPLGTNPVGDDFFFTPMPYTNQNPPQELGDNVKQLPFNPFNPQTYLPSLPTLPSFPNLFHPFHTTTTPPPITAVVLTNPTTHSTQQPVYVSMPPHRRKTKKKVKNVYVDLPIVSEVGHMLDKMYNFMEESLVTKVVKKTETQPVRRTSHNHSHAQSQTHAQVPQVVQVVRPSYVNTQSHTHNQVPQVVQVIPANQIVPLSAIDGSSSDEDSWERYTSTPYYRTTRSRRTRPKRRRRPVASTYYTNRLPTNNWQPSSLHRQKRTTLVPGNVKKDDQNKNYLTTKIHVTSEYVGPQPTADTADYNDVKTVTKSEEDDDDDDYYDDSFALPDLSFEGVVGGDDDDDDDDDDYEYGIGSAEVNGYRKQGKKKNRKNDKQAKPDSLESDSYEDDDDRDDGDSNSSESYAPSMGSFGDFFGNVVTSMNKYVPSFGGYMPSFGNIFRGGSGSKEMDYNSIDREERSTTPKIETRNPKNPKNIFSDYNDLNGIDGEDTDVGGSWYNPFSGEVTTASPDVTEASNDYWNWFGNSNENAESVTEGSASNQNSSGWFFGLFGSEESKPQTTTTTKRPFLTVDNPMYKPHNWLGILANTLVVNKPLIQTPVVKKVSYDNYQLWRLMPESDEHVKFLEDYRITPEGAKLQWWKGPTLRGPTDVAVPASAIVDVKTSLDYEEIPHEVIIWDLEKAIKFENPPMSRREKLEMEITQEHPMSWYRYHRYGDITKFLEYLQRKYPSSVELIHIGRSFEGRPLIVAKVSAPAQSENWKGKISTSEKKKKKTTKKSIFIESGTHAREWITPAVSTWILDQLVHGLNNSDSLGETIRSVDWYIMPVLNPDGYEYSHQYDRLWRKTRSKHKEESSIFSNALNWLRKEQKAKEETCYGTDLNRNWNHNWNEKGSSKSECSEFYAGPKAFSEPETKALSKFLEEHKKSIKIYLSLHSYGQIISYPSRANASYNSIKSDDLLEMAQVGLEALRGSGSSTRYIVDNTNEMMHARSGSSDLYAMYDLGIKYSYAIELRDSGTHGFLLPPSNIDSTAKETLEIIKGMVDYI